MPLKHYASRVGIPYPTLQEYCRSDKGKRTVLGSSVGTASLFSDEQQQFAVMLAVPMLCRCYADADMRRCLDCAGVIYLICNVSVNSMCEGKAAWRLGAGAQNVNESKMLK